MMVSNLIFGKVTTPWVRDRLTVEFTVVAGLPLLAFLFNPPFIVMAILLAVAGSGLCYDLGLELRFVDAVPEDRRGLAFSLRSTGLMTAQGIGPAIFGALAQVVPVGTTIALCGGLTVAAGTGVVLRAMRPLSRPAPAVPQAVSTAPSEVGAAPGAVSVLTVAEQPSECNCPGGCGPSQPAANADEEYEKDTVR
jgi:predicted MFS family arabinose efflux permease